MRTIENKLLRYKIYFEQSDIEKMLTHNSFSEQNNSRYVFAGMTGFKGAVGHWIFKNIGGTGTQLQHFLGNIFSQKNLESYFDKLIFTQIRKAETVDIATQKHVFVYAFFGLVLENATKKQLENFIFSEILMPNDHLMPQTYKHKNQWAQLKFICKQQFDKKPKLFHELLDNKINCITILMDEQVLSKHDSVSYKYARTKTITLALKNILLQIEEKTKDNADYIAIEEQRLADVQRQKIIDKELKQEKHRGRIERHAAKMKIMQLEKEQLAQELDKKRRNKKQDLKEKKTSRKGANTIYKEYTMEEIAAMSNSKRRNLQDKGIIPKGLDF